MLSLKPKLNQKITISDTQTGNRWELWLYYQQGQRSPSLAFDAPQNIVITMGKKPERNESDGKGQ